MPRASWDLSCEVATCRGRSVDQRTDEFTLRDVVFFTMAKNERPELDSVTEAQAALVEAGAMREGPGRTAAVELLRCRKPALFEMLPTHTESFMQGGGSTKT